MERDTSVAGMTMFCVIDMRRRLAASGEEIIQFVARDFPVTAHARPPGVALQYGNVSLFPLILFFYVTQLISVFIGAKLVLPLESGSFHR